MTKLTERQKNIRSAIVFGIGKWKALRDSESTLVEGIAWCSLCYLFMDRDKQKCIDCPLDKAGKHCLTDGGYFDKFYTNAARPGMTEKAGLNLYCEIEHGCEMYLENLDGELKVETAALIDGMISDLNLALKWFDDGGYSEY